MIGNLKYKLMRFIAHREADAGGGANIVWEASGELWASIEQLTPLRDRSGEGRRFLKRIAAEVRADSSINEGERIRYDERDYEIVSIESSDERQRRFVLIGEEVLGS